MTLLEKLKNRKVAISALAFSLIPASEAAFNQFFNEPVIGISYAQDIKYEAEPDLKNLSTYEPPKNVKDKGLDLLIEKFHTADGGEIWKISYNNRPFLYFVDSDIYRPFDKVLYKERENDKMLKVYPSGTQLDVPSWVLK